MTRPTTLARQIDLMVKMAKKHGLQPHIWIEDGKVHMAPLTDSPLREPIRGNPWDRYVNES